MQHVKVLHICFIKASFMTRILTLSVVSVLAGGALFFSCKKIDKPQTRLTRIQHSWQLVKTATDANGNGQIDSYEIQPISESMNNVLTFNTDNTGKETVVANSVTTDYPFTWTMDAKMDTITREGVGHNIIKYYLADISSIAMELTTTSNLGVVAYFYEIK